MRLPIVPDLNTKDGASNKNARMTNALRENNKSVVRPGLELNNTFPEYDTGVNGNGLIPLISFLENGTDGDLGIMAIYGDDIRLVVDGEYLFADLTTTGSGDPVQFTNGGGGSPGPLALYFNYYRGFIYGISMAGHIVSRYRGSRNSGDTYLVRATRPSYVYIEDGTASPFKQYATADLDTSLASTDLASNNGLAIMSDASGIIGIGAPSTTNNKGRYSDSLAFVSATTFSGTLSYGIVVSDTVYTVSTGGGGTDIKAYPYASWGSGSTDLNLAFYAAKKRASGGTDGTMVAVNSSYIFIARRPTDQENATIAVYDLAFNFVDDLVVYTPGTPNNYTFLLMVASDTALLVIVSGATSGNLCVNVALPAFTQTSGYYFDTSPLYEGYTDTVLTAHPGGAFLVNRVV